MDRRKFLITTGLGALCAGRGVGVARAGQEVLTVGIFPRRNVADTYSLFNPLIEHLGLHLGRPVVLNTARNFTEFWQSFITEQFHLVHFNQYHYVLAHERLGYEAIAMNEEFGESVVAGSLMVRRDRGIEQVTDLSGRSILFGGGPRAMMSYVTPTWLLRQAGLQAGDYEARIALNPPNAVISTFLGQADAAGVGDVVIRLDSVKALVDVTQMRFLARTHPLAHLPWAVHPVVDVATREGIQSILVNLAAQPGGQALLDTAKLTGLVTASDADYDPHREIVRAVYGDDMGLAQWG